MKSFLFFFSLFCGTSIWAKPVSLTSQRAKKWDLWTKELAKTHGIPWRFAKAVRIKESFNDPLFISTTGALGLTQLMPRKIKVVDIAFCKKKRATLNAQQYITENYHNFLRARKANDRRYQGKKSRHWGLAYQNDLKNLLMKHRTFEQIRLHDIRFDPCWNIAHGIKHLSADYQRLKKKYKSASAKQLLEMTLVAYYAGPSRVVFKHKKLLIPSYAKTYVNDVFGIYERLKKGLPAR